MPFSSSTSLSKAEKSYIQAGLIAPFPSRADGRSLLDYRSIALETGVAPLANGSARVCIGRSIGGLSTGGGGGGTEIVAATKLEVENVGVDGGVDGGRIVCSVSWSVLSSITTGGTSFHPNFSQLSSCIPAVYRLSS
jgi:exosome complex component RRP42